MRAVEEGVIETTLVRMSPADFAAFLEALSAPPLVVPEIMELAKRAAPWESSA
jgi:uncharacterized protein (DUF1778 family)